jgi:hypothetical protein
MRKRLFFCKLLLAGLLVGLHPALAQVPAGFTALPVRNAWGRRPVFGPFRGRGVSQARFSTSESSGINLLCVALAYKTSSHKRLRFAVENRQSQQLARVAGQADQLLKGGLLANLRAIRHPTLDSAESPLRRVDVLKGVITIDGQPAGEFWEFALENVHQLGAQPLRGTLTSPHQRIVVQEAGPAVTYAPAGGVPAAWLAAQLPRGFLFLLDGQPIAALNLGGTTGALGAGAAMFLLKDNLDPTLQLVTASLATTLLVQVGP